jgi:GNAT superfamily N-acetyltransferase
MSPHSPPRPETLRHLASPHIQPTPNAALRPILEFFKMHAIRPATPDDIPTILALIRELAEYEREPQAAVATHADLLRDGFGQTPRFHCLIAEAADSSLPNNEKRTTTNEPLGFALYFYNYSTWRGHAGIYLEDLFVRPQHRGLGAGKALLARVAAIAVAEGCPRLEWAVLNWNTPAIDFYNAVGAQPQSEWTTMRLSGTALRELVDGAAIVR